MTDLSSDTPAPRRPRRERPKVVRLTEAAAARIKAIMDAARTIEEGSIVTAKTRNGKNFGIRVAGLGDQWVEAPVNTPMRVPATFSRG